MTNHRQHFHITLNYRGPSPETFEAEGIADQLFHDFNNADTIDHLTAVVAVEEPQARPSYERIAQLRDAFTPPVSAHLVGHELAIVAAVTETLDYVLGRTPIEELHDGIERAHYLATPIEERLAKRTTGAAN